MIKRDKKRNSIDKVIASYVFEIFIVIAFMVISYKGFTMNNLSEASKIASSSENEKRDVYAVYNTGKLESAKFIDNYRALRNGSLFLKNPNKYSKDIDVVMQVSKSNLYKIGDVSILVNGEMANMGVIMDSGNYYEIILCSLTLEGYESEELDIALYHLGEPVNIDYSFKLVGDF